VGRWKRIRHVNLGLLPTSRGAWDPAVEVLDFDLGGWIHVHENVKDGNIETKMNEVVTTFQELVDKRDWRATSKGVGRIDRSGTESDAEWEDVMEGIEMEWVDVRTETRAQSDLESESENRGGEMMGGRRKGKVACVHVERVKTYAPGVWHVVFDIWVPPWDGEF